MKTIGIIAEFNPLHNGHKYLIESCKKALGADKCIVVMSSDYVQRGAPAIVSKFTRARTALLAGADLVIELPVYYSIGSAEYFAGAAVSMLDKIGVVDYLCFGSEFPDTDKLSVVADILYREPPVYKQALLEAQKNGESFASACATALSKELSGRLSSDDIADYLNILSSPNSILAVEYLKRLKQINSSIKPYTIQRIGQPYHSEESATIPSASGVRAKILSPGFSSYKENSKKVLDMIMPPEASSEIIAYNGRFLQANDFSSLMNYKLITRKYQGYAEYLDVNKDISNKIIKNLNSFEDITGFCMNLKSKNLLYTRISRCLFHILLNIREDHMREYKMDSYTSYARILGMRETAFDLLSVMHSKSTIPVLDRLKDADKSLTTLQHRLFDETITTSLIYNSVAANGITSEFSMKPIILR